MSQCAEILAWLQSGHTLTKAEAYHKGWGMSLNSRCSEIYDRTGIKIACRTENRNGKTVYVHYLPEEEGIAYG